MTLPWPISDSTLDDKGIAPSLIAAREQLQRSRLEVPADLLLAAP